jgi:hypothetical protein
VHEFLISKITSPFYPKGINALLKAGGENSGILILNATFCMLNSFPHTGK